MIYKISEKSIDRILLHEFVDRCIVYYCFHSIIYFLILMNNKREKLILIKIINDFFINDQIKKCFDDKNR